jgi:1,2-phenylacetyl-CoA epoxidase catalytic subunit
MSTTTKTRIPKKYHDAVVRWQEKFLPDFDYLIDNWDRYFPKDPTFELCAYREMGMCNEIECGAMKGQSKFTRAGDMEDSQTGHLLGAIKAQASTEFGSIQQHQLTLARAQSEEEQFWILRMMAEELRHGYQMFHLLLDDEWGSVSDQAGADMVEEILSMQTGSHILGAFNIDFDSFIDNVTFCCLIDRVGKYQLSMQRISSYKPMAESMPQMLREEAFHLAAGVVPLRRWMEKAAQDSIYITSADIQKAINKWLPRGLEMFGDERGGGTNVKYGLKPMKNAEAQAQYYEEVSKVVHDLNLRFIRARDQKLKAAEAETLLNRLLAEGGTLDGISWDDLVHMPHREFFRRRGVPAFKMIGWDGAEFSELSTYLDHLSKHLPDPYRAGRDFRDYVEMLGRVHGGELSADEAGRSMPSLRRVGGVCPCSRAVRWVVDEPTIGNGNGGDRA